MQETTMNRIRSPFTATRTAVSRLLLAGLIALPGAAVLAQATAPAAAPATTTPAGPATQDADQRGSHMGMGKSHHDPARMQERVAKRHAELKAKLKITAAQEPAWTAFTATMTPPASMMRDRRAQHAELQKLPTPERIDKLRALRTEHMTEMMKSMDQRGDATKALYAALSPEQQKTFDAEAQQGGRHAGGQRSHHGGQHRNS
jgi:periplasmic protein CpxP/Spy